METPQNPLLVIESNCECCRRSVLNCGGKIGKQIDPHTLAEPPAVLQIKPDNFAQLLYIAYLINISHRVSKANYRILSNSRALGQRNCVL